MTRPARRNARRQDEEKALEILRAELTDAELALMAAYQFDAMTQMQLARMHGKPQTTISLHLRKIAARLRARGLEIQLPGRGQRAKVKTFVVAPDEFHLMATTRDSLGIDRAKKPARKRKRNGAGEWSE